MATSPLYVSFHQALNDKKLPIGVLLSAELKAKLSNIRSKDNLVEALQIGVKLEQTVMLEYLYAGFSLRTYPQELGIALEQLKDGVKDSEVLTSKLNPQEDAGYIMEMCRQYKYVLYEISKQEMFHLARASNVLVALGEIPNLRTVCIPSKYAKDIPINLAKFEFSSLKTFLRNEEPYDPRKENISINLHGSKDDFQYMSISELYSNILQGLTNLQDENMFTHCHPELQFHYPKSQKDLIVMSDEIAKKSIQIIQEQGEGSLESLLMFQAALKVFLKWLESVRPDKQGELLKLYKLMKENLTIIIQDLVQSGKVQQLLVNFVKLAANYASWLKNGGPPFVGEKFPALSSASAFKPRTSEQEDKNTDTGFVSPSHFESFFLMAFDYINLSTDIPGNSKKTVLDDLDIKFLNLSRDCAVNPGIMSRNTSSTHPSARTPIEDPFAIAIAEMGNLGYDLLLCLLEANFIPVSEENQQKLKITKRYYYFAYFPVMTMVIRPIGEILTYFRLNDHIGELRSAGMPFEMTDSETLQITIPPTPDIQKFIEITKKMCQLYSKGQEFSKLIKHHIDQMKEAIAPWIRNQNDRNIIQEQIVYRVGRLLNAIEVMVTQYLMQIPTDFLEINMVHLADYGIKPVDFGSIGHCLKPEINVNDVDDVNNHYMHKLYIAVEFEGWALYPMANDPDSTDDPVGTQGMLYSFYYGEDDPKKNDPFFDQCFHTQNPTKDAITGRNVTWNQRVCCPQKHYDGLEVTKVSILTPTYYTHKDGTPTVDELKDILIKTCDFNKFEFLPLEQSSVKQYPNFPMLNYALTNTYLINPAHFKIFSGTKGKDYYIRRADVYVDVDPVHKDKIALFYDLDVFKAAAGSKDGNAFESVQSLLLRHTAVSGGYKQWSHIEGVAKINPGCVLNSVDINAATGVGSDWTDYYLVYKKRADDIWGVICTNIDGEYGHRAEDVKKNLEKLRHENEFGFEIMLYLIITQFNNNKLRSDSIILQKRLINVTKLVQSASVPGFPAPLNNQYVYNIAVNGPDKETIGKDDGKFLNFNMPDNFQLMTKLDWPIQFWVGAMDYDSTAFFIKGTWLIPFYPK